MKVLQLTLLMFIVALFACKKSDSSSGSPSVILTDPTNNVTGVARNKGISFTFSEKMDSSTINNGTFQLNFFTEIFICF